MDSEHDKRIAENYVFDEVQGIYILRSEHEKRVRFNSDTYSPTKDEVRRFPSRPKSEVSHADNCISIKQPTPHSDKNNTPQLKPQKSRGRI